MPDDDLQPDPDQTPPEEGGDGSEKWHIPLEDEPSKPAAHDLDVCPNCGAPMPDADQIVCLRCGFDLKTLTTIKTAAGEGEDAEQLDDDDLDVTRPAISPPGLGGSTVPTIVAVIAGLVLIAGYLAGWKGLFSNVQLAPEGAEVAADIAVDFTTRVVGLAKCAVFIGLLSICGTVGLFLFSRLDSRPIGVWSLAFLRMLAIVTVARLATLMHIPIDALEWPAEAAAQLFVFGALSMVMFRLSPRDSGTMTGITLLVVFGLALLSRAVAWAM